MAKSTTHDPRSDGRLARRVFDAAFMSDTKWRKLFEAVAEARPDLIRVTVKFVDVDEPRVLRFPPDLRCPRPYMDTIEFGPTEFRAIEWLEFDADLTNLCAGLGRFPLSVTASGSRIIGYTSPHPGSVR